MSPKHSVLQLGVEVHVAVAKVVLTAEFKEALSAFIQLSGAELAQADGPGGMVDANTSVEVSEDEERLFLRQASDGLSKIIIELVLALGGGKGGGRRSVWGCRHR